jgi:hypothetical protein
MGATLSPCSDMFAEKPIHGSTCTLMEQQTMQDMDSVRVPTHDSLDVDFACWLQDRGWYLLVDICPAGHG